MSDENHQHIISGSATISPEEFPWVWSRLAHADAAGRTKVIQAIVSGIIRWERCHTTLSAQAASSGMPSAAFEALVLAGFDEGYRLASNCAPDDRVHSLGREHAAALVGGNYFIAALTQLEAVRRLPDESTS